MIPWFQWTTIHLGPITLQVWGLFVSLGMLLSVIIITKWGRGKGINTEKLLDMTVSMIIVGIIFARVFHVLLYEPSFYFSHPLDIIKIWNGGMSSFGGLFGAILFFFFYHKQLSLRTKRSEVKQSCPNNKIASSPMAPRNDSMIVTADILSFAAVFGWIVGRIGCLMIHDHLGVHSNCPLAIRMDGGARLDMALMEILGLIPLAILFFICRKKKMAEGFFTGLLFAYYGALRLILDFYRATDITNPDVRYLGLTPAQYFAILLVLYGSYVLMKMRKKNGRIA